jgi:Abnormal spindle-like microcephaly-assoc'd, ASPM-SPD-2-Hydin
VTKFGVGDQVWPMSLSFANQTVGIASAAQTATLSNSGQTSLNIASISLGGNNGTFSQTNNCGSTLAAGDSCKITVSWTPSAAGSMTGAITITDNAPNSPQTVALSGTGTVPAVTLSPTSLTFPTQIVFTTSSAQTVTLTNNGAGTLNISSIAKTGQFSQTNTCGASVAPGAGCTISVSFRPTVKGAGHGTVSVTDNALGSPQTVNLTGTGTYVEFTPTSLNFGNQPAGTTSLPQTITLTNKGDAAMNVREIVLVGANPSDFAQTNSCGATLASGASCFITVTFTPSVKGKRKAAVGVADSGGGSPQSVSLTGMGT